MDIVTIFDNVRFSDYPPLEFTTEPNTLNPIPELSLKIVLCRASSSPSAQYRWMKDETYITEYNAVDYSYIMMSVNRTDAGIYRYIDNFESHTNQTVNVLSGDGVVINLPKINSVPDPAVSWYASGVEMAPEAQRHQFTLDKNLALLSTSMHSDNGKIFKAVATNGINGVSITTKDFVLRVGGTGEGVPKLPALLVSPKNTTAKTGDRDTKLECIYNARPLSGLQTKWYKKDLKEQKLLPTIKAPLITSQIQSWYLRDFGQSIQVECQAKGHPPPSITWYFNAQRVSLLVTAGKLTVLSVTQSGSLMITNLHPSDTGVYQCFASNAAGETKISTWISVNDDISTPVCMHRDGYFLRAQRNQHSIKQRSLRHTAIPIYSDDPAKYYISGESRIRSSNNLRQKVVKIDVYYHPFSQEDQRKICVSKITTGGAASFAVISIFLLVIRRLTKAYYTTLTVRRDQNTYNEIPRQTSDSVTGQYYEMSPLSSIAASGCQSCVQQKIDQIQHVDTSGYLILSKIPETSGDNYQTISD
ncbi:SDK [Mytilus edulis]|uniref:SDK n=1 Tax=Mytilus edulis TaxID=6550 RepID=A0A8S3S9M5_MYTED|nr:SDK [Mytilus edulis]